jgi:hypothetical protein
MTEELRLALVASDTPKAMAAAEVMANDHDGCRWKKPMWWWCWAATALC